MARDGSTQRNNNFRDVRDQDNNLICRANPATREVEIVKRVHGKVITAIVDTVTWQVKATNDPAQARPPNSTT